MTTEEFLKIQEIFERKNNLKRKLDTINFYLNNTAENSENWNSVYIPNEFEFYLDNEAHRTMLLNSVQNIKSKIEELNKEFEQYKVVKVLDEIVVGSEFKFSGDYRKLGEDLSKAFKESSIMRGWTPTESNKKPVSLLDVMEEDYKINNVFKNIISDIESAELAYKNEEFKSGYEAALKDVVNLLKSKMIKH